MSKNKPLNNIIVLDLTNVLSGPYATMVLGDLGAKVIKVEKPGGDDSRSYGPFKNGISGYFISLNRGKKSIVLNLKNKEDNNIFSKLLSKSDILVENFKPGILEKLGYTWKKISKRYPRLIYGKISGFGESGPYSNFPAYDVVVQAMGGLMSITGPSVKEKTRVGTSIGDIAAGLFCVNGILSALYEREKTGLGSKIDISMLDCQVAILENAIARYSISNKNPEPIGTDHPSIAPFGSFKTYDDAIVIAVGNNLIFKKLCVVIKRDDLLKNKKFLNNELRSKNLIDLRRELENSFKEKASNRWIQLLRKHNIPCSKINNINEVINNPQVNHRNMILDYENSKIGKVKLSGNPIKISGVFEGKKAKKAPELNENKYQILKEFGIEY